MPSATTLSFDIHERYIHHVTASVPPILAAVAALADAVETHPVETVSETLSLLSSFSNKLHTTSGLPFLISPGISAYRRWLFLLLEHPTAGATLSPPFGVQCASEDFHVRKKWIVEASRAYVEGGLAAKDLVAGACQPMLKSRRNPHILVPVCDEAVSASLEMLAKTGKQFSVSVVQPFYLGEAAEIPGYDRMESVHNELASLLKPHNIAVQAIPPQGITAAFRPRESIVLTSSSLLYGNGAVAAPMGTHQVAILARAAGVPFYVTGEAFKQSGIFPRDSQSDLYASVASVDITPSNLITSFVMERGLVQPPQVTDQFVKKWF